MASEEEFFSDIYVESEPVRPKQTQSKATQEDVIGERAPKKNPPRESAAEVLAFAWGGLGTALVMSERDIPVGRVLQIQAPFAGDQLDRLISHTFVDRLLQPIIRKTGDATGVGALILFPALVGIMERSEASRPMLLNVLRQVIHSNLAELAPLLKKQKTDDLKAAKAVEDLTDFIDMSNYPPGTNPIDAIIDGIFSPPSYKEADAATTPGENADEQI
jgi:hypothetical protein